MNSQTLIQAVHKNVVKQSLLENTKCASLCLFNLASLYDATLRTLSFSAPLSTFCLIESNKKSNDEAKENAEDDLNL